MKRVGRIICISIIAILIAIMVITNNASAENYSVQVSYGSNSSVVAGQNVKITITLSEATTLLNGTLSYEKDKFLDIYIGDPCSISMWKRCAKQ